MARLTDEQRQFLMHHEIGLSSLFDATGLKTADYKALMKEEGKLFAYGVTPCAANGHTLRTRAGHCIQCDPRKIAFIRRHESKGAVYIAASLEGQMIKIGSTQDIDLRLIQLNKQSYGGKADWRILATAECQFAGKIEGKVQSGLSCFFPRAQGSYLKDGSWQDCREVFRCDFTQALEMLNSRLGPNDRMDYCIATSEWRKFAFEDVETRKSRRKVFRELGL